MKDLPTKPFAPTGTAEAVAFAADNTPPKENRQFLYYRQAARAFLPKPPKPDPLERFVLLIFCLIAALLIFICWLLLYSVGFPIS